MNLWISIKYGKKKIEKAIETNEILDIFEKVANNRNVEKDKGSNNDRWKSVSTDDLIDFKPKIGVKKNLNKK